MVRRKKQAETEIVWKRGYTKAGVADPVVAHKALEEIKANNGGDLLPEDIVTAARNKESPLHDFFEWNDKKAATERRLDEARGLVRAIHVIRIDNPEKGSRREYEVTPGVYGRGRARPYRTTEELMSDPETRAAMLDRALRELMAFQSKFRSLQELAIVFRSIEEVLETAER